MKKNLRIAGQEVTLEALQHAGGSLRFMLNETQYHFRAHALPDGSQLLEQEVDGVLKRTRMHAVKMAARMKHVQLGEDEVLVEEMLPGAAAQAASALSPRSPMPGLVRQILVAPGDEVASGQPIALMEAMKLQITLTAGGAGIVEALLVAEGDMIAEGTELVRIKEKSA